MTTRSAGPRRETVPAAFDASAFAYDRLTGASPGYHQQLRLSARRMRLPEAGRGLRLLDAGCGTGASTAALLSVAPRAEVTAVRDSLRARAVWQAVSLGVIIPLGRAAAGDAALYRYLRSSVAGFDGAARFRQRLRQAGFTGVLSETVPGWQQGIVHTFLGSRASRELG